MLTLYELTQALCIPLKQKYDHTLHTITWNNEQVDAVSGFGYILTFTSYFEDTFNLYIIHIALNHMSQAIIIFSPNLGTNWTIKVNRYNNLILLLPAIDNKKKQYLEQRDERLSTF